MLGGTMCELGIYSVSRPHTDRQREGGMYERMEDVEKWNEKRGEEEGDRWKERDDGKFSETTDIKLLGIATVGQH